MTYRYIHVLIIANLDRIYISQITHLSGGVGVLMISSQGLIAHPISFKSEPSIQNHESTHREHLPQARRNSR